MPLPPVELQKITISDFEGIDIERGKLVRAIGSFSSLVNYDLVKPGVIRKTKGNLKLNTNAIAFSDYIIAFADYQAAMGGNQLVIFVTALGRVYESLADVGAINFILVGNLFSPVDGAMKEVPYLVSLPFSLPDGTTKQFMVITADDSADVQKFDGLGLTRLGIPNPGDGFTVPFQHSVAVPQLLYNDSALGKDIYIYSSPNQNQGIPVSIGKQYRAAWYNSSTGHVSSLFPLSLNLWPTAFSQATPPPSSLTKPLGTLVASSDAPYVMAAPLFLDNLPLRTTLDPITQPQQDYDSLQIYTTKDGDGTFYLLPIVYDGYGKIISDENGAVPIAGLKYGFPNYNDTSVTNPPPTPLYDGYIPLKVEFAISPIWYAPVAYNDVIKYTVRGAGQTGSILSVLRSVSPNSVRIVTGIFTLDNDATIYRITDAGSQVADPDYTWLINPPLTKSPMDGSVITINFVRPVSDTQLITLFNTSGELPFDRVNDGPPRASWGAVFQGRLFLLTVDKTTIVYSRIEDYESFPPENFFKFTEADLSPITALIGSRQVGLVSQGADQRLIVAKAQSTYQITGTSILDFAITGLFPETGVVHKNAAAIIGGFTVVLSRQGIEVIQGQLPTFMGTKIKDLVDQIKLDEYGPVFTIERKDYQIIMGVSFASQLPTPRPQVQSLILMREPRSGSTASVVQRDEGFLSPFSTINSLPTVIAEIKESGFGQNARILMSGMDANIWQLFTGGEVTPGVPVVAEAITQELPQDNRETRKLFRKVRFDGNEVNDDPGWQIAYSVDDSVFTDDIQMFEENLVGMVGRFLRIRIRHNRAVLDSEVLPQLSNMMVEYSIIGDARGYANA